MNTEQNFETWWNGRDLPESLKPAFYMTWIAACASVEETTEATYDTERALMVAQYGDCCNGGDPMCTGGCLIEKAIRRNAQIKLV